MPFAGLFVAALRAEDLYDLLHGSELVSVDDATRTKMTLVRASIDINTGQVYKEFNYPNDSFVFYEYAIGCPRVHVNMLRTLNAYLNPKIRASLTLKYACFAEREKVKESNT